MDNENKHPVEEIKTWWTLLAVPLMLLSTLLLAYIFLYLGLSTRKWATLGQIGDSFGALNAFLTGGTLVAIIVTIRQTMTSLREMSQAREQSAKDSAKAARLAALGNLISSVQTLLTYHENEVATYTQQINSKHITQQQRELAQAAISYGTRERLVNITHLAEVKKKLIAEFGIDLGLPPEVKIVADQLFMQSAVLASRALNETNL